MTQYVEPGYWDLGYAIGEEAVTLEGANCAQRNLVSDGAVSQRHMLSGTSCVQVNRASAGAVTSDETPSLNLTGLSALQINVCTSGAIVQVNIASDFWLQPGAGKTWAQPNPIRP